MSLLVEDEVAVVDARQRRGDLPLGRAHVPRVVVEIADARVGDVEGALADLREVNRRLDQVEELGIHRHGALRAVDVDLRELAVRAVVAHQPIDAPHVLHHRVERELALHRIVVPGLDVDPGPHHRLLPADPVGAGGGDGE